MVIGIDIGGTKLSAALADLDGSVRKKIRRSTETNWTAKENLAALREMTQALLELAKRHSADVVSIGIGFGGPVDPVRGIVRRSHHVDGWEGVALGREFEKAFGIRVYVDNDANVGALGELAYGAARNRQHVVYVNVGTGIGGALIMHGRLYHGARGNSGEIGHTTIDRNGPMCTCGQRGCLEAFCSGPSIRRRAIERLCQAAPESTSLPTGGKAVGVTPEDVFQAAKDGDVVAVELVDETAGLLGIGIANVLNLVNPELVVIGGGVSLAGDVLLTPLREAILRHAMPGAAEVDVVAAKLGYDAGVLGAVALAVQHAGQ
jgi:glucokinase